MKRCLLLGSLGKLTIYPGDLKSITVSKNVVWESTGNQNNISLSISKGSCIAEEVHPDSGIWPHVNECTFVKLKLILSECNQSIATSQQLSFIALSLLLHLY